MIRPLRQRHRLIFVILALIVLPLLAAALFSRPSEPVSDDADPASSPAGEIVRERMQSFEGGSLRTLLLRGPDGYGLQLELNGAESSPELLVYWDPAALPDTGTLPDAARLLGNIRGSRPRQFDLPRVASTRGRLILYNLVRQETVTSFEMELEPNPRDAE